jgi:hypothetical protein
LFQNGSPSLDKDEGFEGWWNSVIWMLKGYRLDRLVDSSITRPVEPTRLTGPGSNFNPGPSMARAKLGYGCPATIPVLISVLFEKRLEGGPGYANFDRFVASLIISR